MNSKSQLQAPKRCSHGSKIKYKNKKQAIKGATRFRQRYGTVTKYYRCRNCNNWHLTTEEADNERNG